MVIEKQQQIIEIDFMGEIFDLHNAAEFLKIEYVVKTSVLTLFWNYYQDENKVIPIRIKFDRTDSFEVIPRDIQMPKDEDDCLEQIIYNDKMEFIFMGGMKIIVNACTASFEKDKDNVPPNFKNLK